MQVEDELRALGLVLPEAAKVPSGFKFSFAWTRTRGNRIYLSGHGAQAPDGSFAGPFGKVPSEVALEEAQEAARNTALSMLGSLKRELSSKTGWRRASSTKSSREASGATSRVRRRTNPRTGYAKRGPKTSLSTLPAASGVSSLAVTSCRRRPWVRVPSPAARRLRTQLELAPLWVATNQRPSSRSKRSTGVVRDCPVVRPRTVSRIIGPMGTPARSSCLIILVPARTRARRILAISIILGHLSKRIVPFKQHVPNYTNGRGTSTDKGSSFSPEPQQLG